MRSRRSRAEEVSSGDARARSSPRGAAALGRPNRRRRGPGGSLAGARAARTVAIPRTRDDAWKRPEPRFNAVAEVRGASNRRLMTRRDGSRNVIFAPFRFLRDTHKSRARGPPPSLPHAHTRRTHAHARRRPTPCPLQAHSTTDTTPTPPPSRAHVRLRFRPLRRLPCAAPVYHRPAKRHRRAHSPYAAHLHPFYHIENLARIAPDADLGARTDAFDPEVRETDRGYFITALVPGVAAEDIAGAARADESSGEADRLLVRSASRPHVRAADLRLPRGRRGGRRQHHRVLHRRRLPRGQPGQPGRARGGSGGRRRRARPPARRAPASSAWTCPDSARATCGSPSSVPSASWRSRFPKTFTKTPVPL